MKGWRSGLVTATGIAAIFLLFPLLAAAQEIVPQNAHAMARQYVIELAQINPSWAAAHISDTPWRCSDIYGSFKSYIFEVRVEGVPGFLEIDARGDCNSRRAVLGFSPVRQIQAIYEQIGNLSGDPGADLRSASAHLISLKEQGLCFSPAENSMLLMGTDIIRLSDLRPIRPENFLHEGSLDLSVSGEAPAARPFVSQQAAGVGLYAVVIGCGDYRISKNTNIEECTNDAQNVYDTLTKVYGFPTANIRLRKDSVSSTSDNVPSALIFQDLNWLAAQAKSDDMVVFYFSGHGSGGAAQTCSLATQNGTISDATLNSYLNQIKAKNKIAILDSCHSGGFLAVCTGTGKWILTAARANETSKTCSILSACPAGIGGSIFTSWLIDAMTYYKSIGRTLISHILYPWPLFPNFPDTNKDKQISLREAFDYARQGTESLWNKLIGSASHPQMAPGTGDLSIGLFYNPPPAIDTLSPGSGKSGVVVAIAGKFFGSSQGTGYVNFGSSKAAIVYWTDTKIQVKAPAGSGTVSVMVKTAAGTSNGISFTYIK